MESTKKITFKSSDGEVFVVEKVVAAKFQAIKHLIETDCASEIPLHNVTSTILALVIEYCKKHVEVNTAEAKPSKDELKSWDANFLKVDQGTLFEIILAANYLNIESLLDLGCENVAAMIRGKSPEEIRKTFNIENDFTQEDEEEILMENEWAFE